MSSWIDLSAIWKIVVFGLLAGAGLPALFAIGMTALSHGARSSPGAGSSGRSEGDVLVGGSAAGMVIAAICFLIVVAAIGWGIYEIYQTGHPSK
jgi:amino acid transporter